MQSLWAKVYGRQKRAKMGQRVNVQTSMINSVLVGLWFWPKQLQKWSKNNKCLKIGVTVCELCERNPEVSKSTIGNVAGDFYDKGI